MEEYSRPATLEDLKALIRALNDLGADYLLIGGYALFAHGYHRATTDIDVLVPATQEAGQKVREALMVLPDQAAKEIDRNARQTSPFSAGKDSADTAGVLYGG